MESISIENQQKYWEATQLTYHSAVNAELLLFLVKPYIGERVLDAGAGDGALIRALHKRFPSKTIQGVDITPKMPGILKNDLRQLSFQKHTFDTVFCVEVIEHLTPQDTNEVLQEIKRVLKPGGNFIMTTPFAENLEQNSVTCPQCGFHFHRVCHQQSFTEKDYEVLAQDNGFAPLLILPLKYSRVRRFRYLGHRFLTRFSWGRRMVKSKGKQNLMMVACNREQV